MGRNGAEYHFELTACMTFTVAESLAGPAGLSRAALEELIEENWSWISGSMDVLLESDWELESFEELPAPRTP
jgi:hypothetical protein